jgi:hypothetical protein
MATKAINVTPKDRAAYAKLRKAYGDKHFMGAMAIAAHGVSQARLDRLVALNYIGSVGFGNYRCERCGAY